MITQFLRTNPGKPGSGLRAATSELNRLRCAGLMDPAKIKARQVSVRWLSRQLASTIAPGSVVARGDNTRVAQILSLQDEATAERMIQRIAIQSSERQTPGTGEENPTSPISETKGTFPGTSEATAPPTDLEKEPGGGA